MNERRGIRDLILYGILALVLSYIGLYFLALIPIQILFQKRGLKPFTLAVIGLVVAQVAIFYISGFREASYGFFPGDAIVTFLMSSVLWVKNRGFFPRLRTYDLLGRLTILIGAATLPFLAHFLKDESVIALFTDFMDVMLTNLLGEEYQVYLNLAADEGIYSLRQLVIDSIDIFLSVYIFLGYAVLSVTWWIARQTGNRKDKKPGIDRFQLEKNHVWFVLVPGALLLIWWLMGLKGMDQKVFPFVIYILGNVTAISVFLYFIQGFGILNYWMLKRNWGIGLQAIVRITLFLVLFWPGVNYFIVGCFTVLGILELWINFRDLERS